MPGTGLIRSTVALTQSSQPRSDSVTRHNSGLRVSFQESESAFKSHTLGWRWSSVVEHLSSLREVLAVLSLAPEKELRNKSKRWLQCKWSQNWP